MSPDEFHANFQTKRFENTPLARALDPKTEHREAIAMFMRLRSSSSATAAVATFPARLRKVLNLALGSGTPEAEAIAAFQAARRMSCPI